ncbi:MAG: YkgJ family cysteine cluster protein [Candidatus Omnitrophota bacterium]
MSPCVKCRAKCCRYFALEIDTPRSKRDFENVRWFLAHNGVKIYVESRKWHLEVKSECRFLTEDHRCGIYEKRPLICREYEIESCEYSLGGHSPSLIFHNIDELDKYLAKRFKKKKKN